jgi:hypothetical protein
MKSGLRRLAARAVTGALVGTFAVSGATSAHAWTLGSQLGGGTIDPPAAQDVNHLTMSTAGPCTDPTATNAQMYMYGSGFPAVGYGVTANNPISILPPNANGGYDVPMLDTLQNIALAQNPPATYVGTYTIALVCKKPVGQTDYGDYITHITFSDPTHYTSGDVQVATTTTLSASPAGSATVGASVSLTAAVTPSGATGNVQFLDGATNLGTASVSADRATLSTSTLSVGAHSLTAVFTPNGPAGAQPSTSAPLPYTITPAKPVLGAYPSALILPVGTSFSCPDGSKQLVPASRLDGAIYCTSGGPVILVAKGSAPHALVPPSLGGTGKVGSKLTLKPGLWTPKYTSRTVVWKRDGKVIAKQSGTSYVVKKTDKGHRISATVTAHIAGHLDGTASTAPVKAKAVSAVSSSNVSLTTFAKPEGVVGDASPITVPVGTPIGCFAAAFNGATSIKASWLVNGQPYTAPIDFMIPDGLYGKTLTCRTTATNAGGSTVSDAVVKVGKAAALLSYVKPRVVGVAKVGKKLTATAGTWYPTYAKATFVWLRNGKPIKGATKAGYVLTKLDKKHKVSVKVTVTRTGWGTGTATSAAVSVA